MKHRTVTGCFFVAIVFQFGIGVFMTYLAVKESGACRSYRAHLGWALMKARPHFTAYSAAGFELPNGHLCIYNGHRTVEIAYTVYSLFFGERCSPLCIRLIDNFDVFYGRCGGIYRHPDPLALAPSVFRRDTVHITDHRQERDHLRPPYVHLPCHLRA